MEELITAMNRMLSEWHNRNDKIRATVLQHCCCNNCKSIPVGEFHRESEVSFQDFQKKKKKKKIHRTMREKER